MGQPLEAIGVIGYDNATRRYQAVSCSNTATSVSQHVGERNDAGDIVLHLSYEDPGTGATLNRRTVRTMISDNEWIETAHEIRNGTEHKVMEIRPRRTNARISDIILFSPQIEHGKVIATTPGPPLFRAHSGPNKSVAADEASDLY